MEFTHVQLQQAIQDILPAPKLLSFRILDGGISATTIALDVMQNETQKTWVLRAHGEIDQRQNPQIALDEYLVLSILYDDGLPVPRPISIDNSTLPIPYLITEYIEHDTQLSQTPMIDIAEMLKRIHHINLDENYRLFIPKAINILKSNLQTTSDNVIHATLNQTLPYIQFNPTTLLHGDYWSGNILWKDEKIVAVIDWEDMMQGDPLIDVGKSRLEFLWQFGEDKMQIYTDHYHSIMPHLDMTYLPFWDLWGAWRLRDFATWFEDTKKVQHMQKQYDRFVGEAIIACQKFIIEA